VAVTEELLAAEAALVWIFDELAPLVPSHLPIPSHVKAGDRFGDEDEEDPTPPC
jgi:hypothetical protein